MMIRQVLVAALALGAVLGGCESAVSDVDDDSGRLTRQDWVAETINGQPVIGAGRVTLAFVEGRVSGRGGCNIYSGPVEIGNGTLKIGALISTKMACAEPGLMQQESAYLNALQSARRYSFGSEGRLTIATQAGPVVYGAVPKQQRPDK